MKRRFLLLVFILSSSLLFAGKGKTLSFNASLPIMIGKDKNFFQEDMVSIVPKIKTTRYVNASFAFGSESGLLFPLSSFDTPSNLTELFLGVFVETNVKINRLLSFVVKMEGDISSYSSVIEKIDNKTIIGNIFFLSLDLSSLLRFSLGKERGFFIDVGVGASLPLVSKFSYVEKRHWIKKMIRSENMNSFHTIFIYPEIALGVLF